jgi:glycosyltransferase involved in cell wall biosynthesis
LSKNLKENGHTVIPFSMRDSRNENSAYAEYFIDKVDLNKFSIKNIIKIFYNYDAAKKLEKLIKETSPDIAHLHNIDYQLSGAVINVLKKYNIPIIQTLHDYKLICPNKKLFSKNEICERCSRGRYYNCVLRKCAKNSLAKSFLAMSEQYWFNKILKSYAKVDLFIAPSGFIKKTMVRFGRPEKKIKVVYNFISLPISPLIKRERSNKENNYLLYFGRLTKEKGIKVLLEAMKKIKTDIKLKIAGAGEEYENLKFKILDLKLNDKVELLGPKYGEELQKLIKNAKAVIIPSLWHENMPMSLLEAMAAGKAVIASRIGGMPEIIKDGENGFLFRPGDSSDLVRKIYALNRINIVDLEKRAESTVAGLNIKSHGQKILEIYKQVLFKKLANFSD